MLFPQLFKNIYSTFFCCGVLSFGLHTFLQRYNMAVFFSLLSCRFPPPPNWQRNNLYLPEMSSTKKYWHSLKKQFVFFSQMYHVQLNGPDSCPCWPNFTKMACQRLDNLLRNGYFLYGNIPITNSFRDMHPLPQRSVAIRKCNQTEGTSIFIPNGDITIFSNLFILQDRKL